MFDVNSVDIDQVIFYSAVHTDSQTDIHFVYNSNYWTPKQIFSQNRCFIQSLHLSPFVRAVKLLPKVTEIYIVYKQFPVYFGLIILKK